MLLFKLFDVGDSGGDQNNADDKSDKDNQKPADGDTGSQDDNRDDKSDDKSDKKDDTDYKAKYEAEKKEREKAETAHRELQSGSTPKFQRLAELEKAEEDRKPKEDDDLARIDKRIADVDKQIPLYQNNVDEMGRPARLDTTSLEASKDALVIQRKRIIEDKHAQAASAQVANFRKEHKDLKNSDFDALTDIMQEAENKGQPMGLYAAYEIYDRDQRLTKAKESANIDDETRDLGKKALGQDGKPLPDKGGGEKQTATQKFYEEQYGKEKAAKMLGSGK